MQAKRMHISVCVKIFLRQHGETKNRFLILLDKLTSICAEHAVSAQIEKAICQALPGKLHDWVAQPPCLCMSLALHAP